MDTPPSEQPSLTAKGGRLRYLLLIAAPVAVVLALVVLGYQQYVASRARYISDSYTRSLASLAEQTEGSVDALSTAFNNAVRKWSESPNGRSCETLDRQLGLIPLRLRTPALGTPASAGCSGAPGAIPADSKGTQWAAGANAVPTPIGPGSRVEVTAQPSLTRLRQTRDGTHRVDRSVVEVPMIETADAVLSFCLLREPASAGDETPPDDGSPEICAEKRLSEILRPYLAGSPIRHLDTFVVDTEGQVLFERGRSGLRLARLPKAGSAAATDGKKASASLGLPTPDEVQESTVIRPITIEGAGYRLFSQPLRLHESSHGTQSTWAIGVLVPDVGFESEGRRLPLSVVAGVPLILLVALLVLPFVKLATIGDREPLTAATVAGLVVASLLGAALVCNVALDWFSYRALRERLDEEVRALASEIQRNFAKEVELATKALVRFRDDEWLAQSKPNVTEGVGECSPLPTPAYVACTKLFASDGPVCRSDQNWNSPTPLNSAFNPRSSFADYPWFDMLGVANADGTQREKWTIAEATTLQIDMTPYRAHQDVMSRRLLRAADLPSASGIALNVMTSPNTAQILTLLSTPIDDAVRPTGAAFIVTDLLSVKDPLMPPDLGFAIVDQQGRVLFHSTERLRLYENFFAETSGSRPLRSALFSSTPNFFDIDYHGQPSRVLVQSLPGSEWGLIVFRDKDLLRMANAEIAFVVIVYVLFLFGGYVLWLALARWLFGPGAFAALQPDPRAASRYWMSLLPLALLIAWVVAALVAGDHLLAEFVAVLGALTALSGVLLVLVPGHGASGRRWAVGLCVLALLFAAGLAVSLRIDWRLNLLLVAAAAGLIPVLVGWEPNWIELASVSGRQLTRAYTSLAVALVLILAVLPAAAIFRDAFAMHSGAMVRTRQLRLADSIVTRERELSGRERKDAWRVASEKAREQLRRWELPGLAAFREAGEGVRADSGPCGCAVTPDWLPPPLLKELCTAPSLRSPKCGRASAPFEFDPSLELCRLVRAGASTLLLKAMPIFTQESEWMRNAHARRAADCSWETEADGRLCFQPVWAGMGEVEVPAWDASPSWPSSRVARWALAGAGLLALLGLWLQVRWVVGRVFNLELWECPAPDDLIETGRGEYWIRPSSVVRARLRARSTHWIDCESISDPRRLAAAVPADAAGRVVIDHIERDIDEPARNLAQLQMLEDLALRRHLVVDVLSEIDILPHFSQRMQAPGSPAGANACLSAGAMMRWARVLEVLDKHRVNLPPAPLPPRNGAVALLYAECRWTSRLRGIRGAILGDPRWTAFSEEQLLEHIGDLADAHYRVIWSQLTEEERLVLIHLATTGFLNPKNRRIARSLMRRRLIRRTPLLRLMNESFRRFVGAAEARATIRDWERAAGASVWAWVRNGVLAVVIVGAIFLFLTQPESYAQWAALLTALTTVGGGMTTLLGLFQSRRISAGS